MSSLYEVSSLIALVMNKQSVLSQVLGILTRGTKIDVINISDGWAQFRYNNTNAYVKNTSLKSINNQTIVETGSVIIKYLDLDTNAEVYTSQLLNNLPLGTYNYDAPSIYGYKLTNHTPQIVNLTTVSPNQTIIFYYSRIVCSVTINYIDENTNTNISNSIFIDNLSLGSYSYGAIEIEGYSLNDVLTKTVTLTESNPNITISFKYKEILGSVVIKYLSNTTSTELLPSETINNLKLGNYTYTAKSISGYTVANSYTQTVTLTSHNPNVEVAFMYTKLYGSVTIKYIDENTGNSLASEDKYSNLEFGSYSYTAKAILDYKLISNSTQTTTISDTNLNTILIFKYAKIFGSVTIKYIDIYTDSNLKEPTIISNLPLGEYTYDSIEFHGYNIINSDTQSVTLSQITPDVTIIFEYEKIVIPADLNLNEVPYISTYYIKPIVKPGEEVLIDYYITDYYYKEYLEDDYSLTFTVTVRIEGQKDKVYPNLKAGDHQVSLGSFSTEGEQKFSILCTDKYGRNSHELFNFFLVQGDVEVKEYVMTDEDLVTYNIKNTDNYEAKKIIDLSSLTTKNSTTVKAALVEAATNIIPQSKTYVCVIADTDGDGNPNNWWGENQVVYASDYDKDKVLEESTNTRKGLQQLLDDKKAAGYNKLTLLPGTYRIDHQKQIYIPTNFTLNMNGATLKQNQFTGASSLMIEINNTINSHVINGIIEGDYFSHDYANSTNNSEWVNGVSIGGESKYSSFENLSIKNITGYGSTNGLSNSRDGSLSYTYIYPKGIGNNFKIGDIDRNTGLDLESTTRTTSDYIDISGYYDVGYISISVYLGYQGNPCGTWNLICHFYDENKKSLKSIDSYQYRRISVPLNAKYMRITILNESYPTNLSIQYFRIPTHCSFKNVKYENCRCVGMAPAAMKDMLVENCEFTNCGQSGAKCALDAEDGWDSMQDVTFKSLKFNANPNNYFLTCAGHNFIIDGQQNGKAYIWERTRSLIIKNCKNIDLTLQGGGKDNIVRHGVYRVFNNNFNSATTVNNLSKYNTASTYISGLVSHSTLSILSSASIYTDCIVSVSSKNLGYLSSIAMTNCEFTPISTFSDRYSLQFNGGHLNNYSFNNCKFNGKCQLSNNNGFYSATFSNCSFNDVFIIPSVLSNSDDLILFENCNINYTESNFIYYSPAAYTKGTYSQIKFDSCTITNSNSKSTVFIYAYAKPNGYCYFNNCTIILPSTITIFDGYPTNISYIENYTINFENSSLLSDIKLISDNYKSNSNIKINII
ncbi:MucBP domain-containing protein [Clostridium disporicum]|uniref:MucBP domain-containing protein n=1 Tax=Clostridium disporicum TaxID=84024 RepID=A0A173Z5Q7_9CLOT|nr:MucBP domain-containing protein [Clostridium disporicum]CUN71661.1 Uncharacterised protein [Clostridium disporicum]